MIMRPLRKTLPFLLSLLLFLTSLLPVLPARAAFDGVEAMVALGTNFTLALSKDGTVWGWGENNRGQLGTTASDELLVDPTPIVFPGAMEPKITYVAIGGSCSYAIDENGQVWSWGDNRSGQLGIGDSELACTDLPTPVLLNGEATQVVGSDEGAAFAIVDGEVWAWGNNSYGKLGIGASGEAEYEFTPKKVQVAGDLPLEDVEQIAVGSNHALALKSDGGVWYWRSSGNQNNFKTYAEQIVVPEEGFKRIAAGSGHSVLLNEDNSVWVFGDNGYGALGIENVSALSTPTKVDLSAILETSGETIEEIAAGRQFTILKTSLGQLWAAGKFYFDPEAETDNNIENPVIQPEFFKVTLPDRFTPTESDLNAGIYNVSAGGYCAALLDISQCLWVWGANKFAEVGTGGPSSWVSEPRKVHGLRLATTPAFSPTETHKVTFKFEKNDKGWWRGGGSEDQRIEEGESAWAPVVLGRTAGNNIWIFTGWDKEFHTITEDITVNAIYRQPASTTITTTSLPPGTVGANYDFTIHADGEADVLIEVFEASAEDEFDSLPSGLTAEGGRIHGTPEEAGNFNIYVQATSVIANDWDEKILELIINPASDPPQDNTPQIIGSIDDIDDWIVDTELEVNLSGLFSAPPAYPYGLSVSHGSIDTETNLWTWIPDEIGTFTITVTATNDAGTKSIIFNVTVIEDTATDNTPQIIGSIDDIDDWIVDTDREIDLSELFSAPPGYPFDLSVSHGSLDAQTNLWTWTPSEIGTFTIIVTATNSAGFKSIDFTVKVIADSSGEEPPEPEIIVTQINNITSGWLGEPIIIDLTKVFRHTEGKELGYEAVSGTTPVGDILSHRWIYVPITTEKIEVTITATSLDGLEEASCTFTISGIVEKPTPPPQPSLPPVTYSEVTFEIRDGVSHAPLSNVPVKMGTKTLYTNANGYLKLLEPVGTLLNYQIDLPGYKFHDSLVLFPEQGGTSLQEVVYMNRLEAAAGPGIYTIHKNDLKRTWIICRSPAWEYNPAISREHLVLFNDPAGYSVDAVSYVSERTILVALKASGPAAIPEQDLILGALPQAFYKPSADTIEMLGKIRVLPDSATLVSPSLTVTEDEINFVHIALKLGEGEFADKLKIDDFILENLPDSMSVDSITYFNKDTAYLRLLQKEPAGTDHTINVMAKPTAFKLKPPQEPRALLKLHIIAPADSESKEDKK